MDAEYICTVYRERESACMHIHIHRSYRFLQSTHPFLYSASSRMIFSLQKKTVRLVGSHPRTSCRRLFKQLQIQPVLCQHILSLLHFTVNNLESFHTNSSTHNVNTRNKHHYHTPNASFSSFFFF